LAFDSKAYGQRVAQILALDHDGNNLISLVASAPLPDRAAEAQALLSGETPAGLFPRARAPEEALAGLWLYFSGGEECHKMVQDLASQEASFWHAIVHRREPDADNSAYWFRLVGSHPVFPRLNRAAAEILHRYPESRFDAGADWDPFRFIEFCERARRESGSSAEQAALEIQRAEWQLLFDYCARTGA